MALCIILLQGLAGSSAIVTATLKCLMEFFHVTDSVSYLPISTYWSYSVVMLNRCINVGPPASSLFSILKLGLLLHPNAEDKVISHQPMSVEKVSRV